jgi:hypothetical protein
LFEDLALVAGDDFNGQVHALLDLAGERIDIKPSGSMQREMESQPQPSASARRC